MKVFITRKISYKGVKLLKDAGIEISEWKEKRELTPKELIENCRPCNAMIAAGYNKMDASFLNACSHLKVISLHSAGFDNVDLIEATRLNIPVGNTPGVVSEATADIAFLLMLAASRKAFYHYRRIINGDWNFFDPTAGLGLQLKNKTLGIFGLGKIGSEMAKRCIGAYNMKIIYCNRHQNVQAEKELNAVKVSFIELLAQSDILSVHSTLNSETRGKFDKTAFEKMRPTSIFINTARGSIHNEQDLISALQNKIIWGAGLDVCHPEPMNKNNPLLTMPTVAILPHIGSATEETRNSMSEMAAKNVIAALNGKQIPFIVNPQVYDLKKGRNKN